MLTRLRSVHALAAASRYGLVFAVVAALLFSPTPSGTAVAATTTTAWGWGYNGWGAVGDTSLTSRSIPVPVVRLPPPTRLSAGYDHSLGLLPDGSVWAWGSNYQGQLGDATPFLRTWAARVPNVSGIVEVAAGAYFSLARTADGAVWAWGANSRGVLGLPTDTGGRKEAAKVDGLDGVTAVAAGYDHALAVRADGTVWAWS